MSNTSAILRARTVSKTYRLGAVSVPVLKGASLSVAEGEWVAILGASGSGKSTLMHVLGDLDQPDEGDVTFDGQLINDFSQKNRDRYRNQSVGFVFQFYHLLPELNVLDNTMLPEMISGSRRGWLLGALGGATGVLAGMSIGMAALLVLRAAGLAQTVDAAGFIVVGGLFGLVIGMLLWPSLLLRLWPAVQRRRNTAVELLKSFGLGHRLKHRPRELSGGERQRVAIARALMNKPRVLLADEPTGNLDEKTGGEILDLIAQQHKQGLTIVMVTHDPAIAKRADRIVRLHDGRVAAG